MLVVIFSEIASVSPQGRIGFFARGGTTGLGARELRQTPQVVFAIQLAREERNALRGRYQTGGEGLDEEFGWRGLRCIESWVRGIRP